MTLAVLLGSAGKSFALPECPGSPLEVTSMSDLSEWDNCEGTYIVSPTVSGFAGENMSFHFGNLTVSVLGEVSTTCGERQGFGL